MNATQVLDMKARVRERDGNRCTKCGMTKEEHIRKYGRILDVHRVVPGSKYTVEGCVTLCKACHGLEPKSPSRPVMGRSFGERPMYFRLDDATNAALAAFIEAQRVAPSQPSVGLQALHEFLQREGFWPPKANR